MGKIFYIMGKSSSGKDTVYSTLLESKMKGLNKIVLYTTRPIRNGETQGREYYFVDDAKRRYFEENGKMIELRSYSTVHGIWTYFTADDGQIDLEREDYLGMGTLESFEKLKEYYGTQYLYPIYIEVEDGMRLKRAIMREEKQEVPQYAEMCRRFLADTEDFSEKRVLSAGITRRFENKNLEDCIAKIKEYIGDMR